MPASSIIDLCVLFQSCFSIKLLYVAINNKSVVVLFFFFRFFGGEAGLRSPPGLECLPRSWDREPTRWYQVDFLIRQIELQDHEAGQLCAAAGPSRSGGRVPLIARGNQAAHDRE